MNKDFWSLRYQKGNTGWDIGNISTPLKEYIDHLHKKELKILIPGAGNSYEAEYLFEKGFKNIWICDIAKEPIENFKKRLPEFPESQILNRDFFELKDQFDLILEQTFFCALPVNFRENYAKKVFELLKVNGKISGVLFDFPLTPDGPPFGGSKEEYLAYFSPYFKINTFERCYNSINPRQGKELFFNFSKK
ncbi:methyltransferase domain-containing protein [Christiangramia forsetii]|uniref:Thiopurine S-methyltransferase n=2 Tax=Christiangramia forsetii TaxID=411153 RepID=A0M419_CHRFK|nr:methyltransferase domain-containing protein [Christiangramia forsetii]GGG24442.1 SAM-dependent methyltransferase [Christiangramia forsetii]CAL67364.1 thiopurine S-methyltransferase [Christiangramia forsetii KT0803]